MGLRTPEQIFIKARVDSEASYRAHLERRALDHRSRVIADDRTLVAYANHGRWVADCPFCNAGIAIHPAWSFAGCLECFRAFTSIEVPEAWAEIEVLLERRRRREQQNWIPTETLDDVRRDNDTLGVS